MQAVLRLGARLGAISVLLLGQFSLSGAEVVPYGANWKYLIGSSEASSPDTTAWRNVGFDDSKWTSAPVPIGYANPPNSAAEATLVTLIPSAAEGNYSCVFLRSQFVAKSPSAGNVFTVNVNVDDGCIVWINGVEAGRFNAPDGELAYNSWALSAGEEVLTSFTVTNGALGPVVAGTNVIAVQLFNGNVTSSDIFFDLSLESDLDETPPVLISTDPAAGSTISELSHLDVIFTENVTGVDASDLLINGVVATGMTVISPREYNFTFPAQPDGNVAVAWIKNHGIADLSSNPFGGGSWGYSVQPANNQAEVIISEFLADNQHGVKDEDGDRSDWVELLNTSNGIADLNGWFLTDDPANLTKWPIPPLTLDVGKYFLIFASGKNKTNTSAPLHTNFKIEKSGGYLALVNAETNIVSAFAPYPRQQSDISYGRDANNPTLVGFLSKPTPAGANVVSGPGFAPEVSFSIPGGVYTNNSVSVTINAASGQIRYTTDGSVPTSTSTLYTSPVNITTCVVLKARTFQTGLLPGPVEAQPYTMVDSTVRDFTSNLPLIILSTGGRGIGQDVTPRTLSSIVAVDTYRGRAAMTGKTEFVGQGGIEVRGQTSSGFPKQQYNFTFENGLRQQEGVGLFGLPADADWALYAPYSDKPFLQNFMAYELYEKMGHYSVRRKFVEVFLNTRGGKLSYNSDYAGIYILVEKIKIDKNRVDIDQLTPYNTTEPDISGGYMFKKDKDSPGDYNFSTPGSSTAGFSAQALKLHQPKPIEATTAQKNWLRNYLTQMEKALYASNWKTATGTNHWSYYLDADSFVDYHWITEFGKQIDGYRLSTYFYKPRNGKVHMSPIWDYNLSFGNADYLDGLNTSSWYWQELGDNEHIWLRRLMCGTAGSSGTTGDPDFNQRIIDRWSELRTNVLAGTNVIARAQELAAALSEAADRDFQRWPRLGTYVWPNPPLYSSPTTFAGIIQSFTNWIKGRYTWIDSQFLPVPVMDLPGGLTRPGATLTMAGPGAGSIYYTVDGSDPRVSGGALSTKALRYAGSVSIQTNSKVFARRLNGTTWSGPSVRSFFVQKPTLAISEIMYHPAAAPDGSILTESDFEFIEIRNTGSAALALQGVTLGRGIQFIFGSGTLEAGSYIVVAKNPAAFQSRYGPSSAVVGPFAGELNNGGDTITLTGALGELIAEVKFKDGWYPATDGAGFSLVPRLEGGSNLNDASSWQPSTREGGSPGSADTGGQEMFPNVVVNELLASPAGGGPQQLELHNLSDSMADISGWFGSDNLQKPKKFRIPAGTKIPANGFVVFTSDDFGKGTDPFFFDPAGEEVYLFSADAAGNLTGYVHGFSYGGEITGKSLGRYVDSSGRELFVTQDSATFGQENAGPWYAPFVISEINYHPPDVLVSGTAWNNSEDEFVEIVNRSARSVGLYDSANPQNTWRVDGGVQFTFPTNTVLAPDGFALLVSFDPVRDSGQAATFRSRFDVPQNVPLFGPFKGNLGNDSDRVSLQMPDVPASSGTVAYLVEDEVDYSDKAPWNGGADGFGFSLARRDLAGFGNDPGMWTAAIPSAGRFATPGGLPVITMQPKSQLTTVGQSIVLTVQATGATGYQWLFKGQPVALATGAAMNLADLQSTNSGDYTVVVSNATGATTSQRAFVSVASDSDGDGMPDDWEYCYGLKPFDPADKTEDADDDGFSNFDEYVAGTSPSEAESFLSVLSAKLGAIRFFAAPARSYAVIYSDSIIAPVWKKLIEVEASPVGGEVTCSDSASGLGQRFYRIVTPSP